VHVIKSSRSKRTEKRGERVVPARVVTGSRRPEVKPAADGDVRRTTDVGVALPGAAARHGRPTDGVERREVKSEHVAASDSDKLGSLENDLVEAEFGWLDVGLSDQRVDSTKQRPVGRAGRRRSPDLQKGSAGRCPVIVSPARQFTGKNFAGKLSAEGDFSGQQSPIMGSNFYGRHRQCLNKGETYQIRDYLSAGGFIRGTF